jgi:catechol 2,3-dioxygenase-like lactoylglutathione lyase family enzyme
MVRLLKVSPRLPVRDLARTIEFYTSVLGFETSGSWPADEPTFVILERDDTILHFYVPGQDDSCGFGTISIDTDDARSVHSALAEKVVIEWGPRPIADADSQNLADLIARRSSRWPA